MKNKKTLKKSNYVDGFVLIVPKKKVPQYRKMAVGAAKIWMKYGALDYMECMGDDLTPHMGEEKILTFPEMVKVRKDETVWFSYITYESRAHRNKVNKLVMKEMEKSAEKYKDMTMPFDMKRMAYGGFKVVVSG